MHSVRRVGRVAGLALVGALIVASCSSGGSGTLSEKEQRLIGRAADISRLKVPSKFAFALVASSGGRDVTLHMTGKTDPATHASLVSLERPDGGGYQTVTIGDTLYVKTSGAYTRLQLDPGIIARARDAFGGSSQFAMLRKFAAGLHRTGTTTVDGHPATTYRGALDFHKIMKALGETGMIPKASLRQLQLVGSGAGGTLSAAIDKAGRLRRMELKMNFSAGGRRLSLDEKGRVYDFGKPVDLKAPPSSKVERTIAVHSGAQLRQILASVLDTATT